MHLIAVYGTLRRGEVNYDYLDHDGATFVGIAKMVKKATMFSVGSYPILSFEGTCKFQE